MNSSSVPSLDALAADLSMVEALPTETAKGLCLKAFTVGKALEMQVLAGQRREQGEQTKKNALTVEQVAAILNVDPSFVYEQARRKKLKSYKVGRYVRFTEAAVNDYLKRSGA